MAHSGRVFLFAIVYWWIALYRYGRYEITVNSAFKRGIFHICGGLTIMVLALVLPVTVFLILLAAGTFIFLTFELVRLKSPVVNTCFFSYCKPIVRDEEVSRLTGASYIFVAALLVFLLFRKEIALVAFGFLVIGDPLAAIVGNHAGKIRLLKKTLEGDIACLLSCIGVALVFYYLGFAVLLPVVIVGALVATIAEAIQIPVNDNLTIPLFSAVAMALVECLITV